MEMFLALLLLAMCLLPDGTTFGNQTIFGLLHSLLNSFNSVKAIQRELHGHFGLHACMSWSLLLKFITISILKK